MTPKHVAVGFSLLLVGTFVGTLQSYFLLKYSQKASIILPVPVKEIITSTPSPTSTPSAILKPTVASIKHYVYPTYTPTISPKL